MGSIVDWSSWKACFVPEDKMLYLQKSPGMMPGLLLNEN